MKRTPLKKISEKRKGKLAEEREMRVQEYNMFEEIWGERPHRSEVSGTWLGHEGLSTFFHHILPKSRFPALRYEKENIILLTFQEHNQVESHPEFYPEINRRRDELKLKFLVDDKNV